jgi:type I site-specific restriction endonuclease
MYPEHNILLARVITSQTERNKDLLKQFQTEILPRISISLYWYLYNMHHN